MVHIPREVFEEVGWPDRVSRPMTPEERAQKFSLRLEVFVRDGFRCRDCGRQFTPPEDYYGQGVPGLTLGHVIPKSFDGEYVAANLIAQCQECNDDLADEVWTGPRYPDGRPGERE